MKKILAAAGLGAAVALGSLVGAGTAKPALDTRVNEGGIYNDLGPSWRPRSATTSPAHLLGLAIRTRARVRHYRHGRRGLAYSPVTGGIYKMQCAPGFIATFYDGSVVNSGRCVGGNNAVVVVW